MSCMMTDTKGLTILAAYVKEILEGADQMGTIEGVKRINPPKGLALALNECRIEEGLWDIKLIYGRLYRLNEAAYCGRYGEEAAKVVPSMDEGAKKIITADDSFKEWATRLWNLVRFYNYQCSEDATRGDSLHLAMLNLQDTLAHCVAKCAAEDFDCIWGRF